MSLLHVHTKRCFAAAMISAVENFRDDSTLGSVAFRELTKTSQLYVAATEYLSTGLQSCTCRVAVYKRVTRMLESGDVARAQSYATAELGNGIISPEDYAEIARESGKLPPACIHPGLFFPIDGDIEGTSTCQACGTEVPNYDL